MSAAGIAQGLAMLVAVLLLAPPVGAWMARVLEGRPGWLGRALGPLERLCYRLAGVDPAEEMDWKRYTAAVLLFNLAGFLLVFALQRLQAQLPLNPAGLPAVPGWLAFNTAVSFMTNTNWQAYSGEATMSLLTQMAGLTVQNFLSAATGLAVLAALARAFTRRGTRGLGSFWADLTRGTLYILLPLSIIMTVLLVSQGVPQTFHASHQIEMAEAAVQADGTPVTQQTVAVGPVASQIAIKQLGSNGGGYYNANSTHPLENPTPLSNQLELLAILLLPLAGFFTFGRLTGRPRQGWALFAATLLVLVPLTVLTLSAESGGNPRLAALGADQTAGPQKAGGNLEGKELRHGAAGGAIWACATTATSNGSVNAMHDSFTPLGGLAPLLLMQTGEVTPGGIGCGVYGLLMFAVVAVFLAGLMVGRTPELLGKKLEAFEMKMAALSILLPSAALLVGTALACAIPSVAAAAPNPGPHGFSELLYAFSSACGNNGSAFAGLDATKPFWTIGLGLCMFIARFGTLVPVMAIAGSLARKGHTPAGLGTLPTDTTLFVVLLAGSVLLVGMLTFLPALALGPIVEHLMLFSRGGM